MRTKTDPKIAEAALRTAALGEENLRFFQDVYKTDLKPLADRQAALAEESAKLGMDIARENQGNAQQDRSFYEGNFRPLEQQLTQSVANMNTQDYADRKASEAMASVESAYGQAQQQARRNLARSGVQANNGQVAANELNGAVAKAGMVAQASNAARDQADALKFARTAQVVNVGRGVNNDSNAATQIAMQGAGAAMGAQGQALSGAAGAAGVAGQGYGGAIAGNNASASILQAQQAARMQQSNANAGAIGQIVGSAIMMSDENAKTDIKEVDSEKARKQLRKAEPKKFRYLPGMGPEGEFTHAMAQDMKAAGSTASDGKQVHLGGEIGELHAGMIGVDKRVDELTRQVRQLTELVGA